MLRATGRTVVLALIAGLAACSDGAVSPKNATTQDISGNGALATLTRTDTVRFSFVVNPAVTSSFYLGAGNSVRFPAGSVCDPSSSYGVTEWDNACTPAAAPITISASAWLDPITGNPRVDFANHLRFVPSTDPLNWVTLAFTDLSAALNPSSDILYCTTAYSQCVSELSGDATLITVKNPVTGLVTRRIKHFSGYLLGSGEDCDTCTEGSAFNRAATPLTLPPVLPPTVSAPSASSASANIGPAGGVLKLASAGLTVVVPPGALASTTRLSLTSRAGSLLSYEFEPHGTQFAVPVRVTQDFGGADLSSAATANMHAVYFASESQVDDATGDVVPTELMPVEVNAELGQVSFEIHHFSGYMFATGDVCGSSCMDNGAGAGPLSLSFSRAVGDAPSLGAKLSGVKRSVVSGR